MDPPNLQKLRVCIVGSGAAGMSAAYAFSQHPDRFDVTLYERSSSPGGMATSTPINQDKYGASYINDGVQGASPVFHNTYAIFERLGFSASDVGMQVSFGKDAETEFWSNVFPSQVIDKFSADIKKFGKVLKIIKMFEPVFAIISVNAMLKIFRFSKEFGETIVFPLVALFFGTGNQTPFISSAILERVFMDPNMRLFEYSPESFLASIPTMRAFPRLSTLYEAWKSYVEEQSQGSVRIVTNREVTRVQRFSRNRGGVEAWSRLTHGTDNNQSVLEPGDEECETFDEIIICTDADAALQILGNDAKWLERHILGNVKYLWDLTVTHNDLAYMEKYYRVRYDPSLCSTQSPEDPSKKEQFEFAEKGFSPLYFIRSYPEDKKKVEMSFDLTCYQPQFDGVSQYGPHLDDQKAKHSSDANENHSAGKPAHTSSTSEIPLNKHVFQTIFLDNTPDSSRLWSKDEIDRDKVIVEKWWKQQSHRWQHYAGTVPWMGLINGKNHTHFAGAWTILNMHEIAVVSGLTAAYMLGAAYPFLEDLKCKRLFTLCLAANHLARLRKEDRDGFLS
ncbi:hypothetical protein BDZ94DRAFT_582884 [Collybia nuda]|uniref:FAD/NAD(P)-binding domain-containing protein n=1 Tax=Collybia nuda TaxID=64659 RepID=A0A9P5Y614_9AGAR|nr:hypothetical protein BDZ94DRAFT_582884 [Collybia nuda]